MAKFELTDLTRTLRECAGTDETVDLQGDILDLTFTDLGYDSLAMLQTTGHIERSLGLRLDEDAVSDADTPRRYLAMVNDALSAGTAG
ncbi:acyl carrier protein [Streptomyces sp. S186]|uniref:acyl carrier protein n=1 Tax=Streptomyces sp. S186 TaxID=3434395 RepID=UPI003F67EE72